MWFSQQKKICRKWVWSVLTKIVIEFKLHRMDIFLAKDHVKIANNLKFSEAKIKKKKIPSVVYFDHRLGAACRVWPVQDLSHM